MLIKPCRCGHLRSQHFARKTQLGACVLCKCKAYEPRQK